MPELSLVNIEQIIGDIRNQDITFSHLPDDLIDHVCCDVENEMHSGLDFFAAYKKVKKKIGPRRIKEIQEETLYMVDTKYRNMKNTMKISGIAGTILYGFAVLFKIQHWAGAGILMTLGALILALVFMPSALTVLWKETQNKKRIFLFISAFFSALFFISGTLFKLQHWPGAAICLSLAALSGVLFFIPALMISRMTEPENKSKRPAYILGATGIIFYVSGMFFKIQHWPLATILLVLGMVLLCAIALPVYTYVTWKDESHIKAPFIFLMVGSFLIILPGALINLNLQRSFDQGFFVNQEQQQGMYNYLYDNNTSFLQLYQDSISYQKMEQLHSGTAGLITTISNLQAEIVRESEGQPGSPATAKDQIKQSDRGMVIEYRLLSRPFLTSPVTDHLLPECTSRKNLDNALAAYKELVSRTMAGVESKTTFQPVDLSALLPVDNSNSDRISIMTGLHSLELIKNSLLACEWQLLNEIANNR